MSEACCNCLGCQAHQDIMKWQNIAIDRLKEIEKLKSERGLHHDEGTLFKVAEVLQRCGTGLYFSPEDIIRELQNAGIYFREAKPDG